MRKIAVVHSGSSQHQRTFNEPKYNKYISEIIYFPDLAETSLDEFDVLLMPSQLHKGLLEKNKEKIRDFSDQGGIVVSFGPQPCDWIPNQKWEFRPTNFWWCMLGKYLRFCSSVPISTIPTEPMPVWAPMTVV